MNPRCSLYKEMFECKLLEMFVIPNVGLGPGVLLTVKYTDCLKREGLTGGFCAQLGSVWADRYCLVCTGQICWQKLTGAKAEIR